MVTGFGCFWINNLLCQVIDFASDPKLCKLYMFDISFSLLFVTWSNVLLRWYIIFSDNLHLVVENLVRLLLTERIKWSFRLLLSSLFPVFLLYRVSRPNSFRLRVLSFPHLTFIYFSYFFKVIYAFVVITHCHDVLCS